MGGNPHLSNVYMCHALSPVLRATLGGRQGPLSKVPHSADEALLFASGPQT